MASPLVVDPDAFLGHVKQPLARDSQLAELRGCISNDVGGMRPMHVWIHGPPGTGKTLCVRYLLEQLARPKSYLPIYVSCPERFTFLSVIERILDTVKPLRSTQKTKERQVAILREVLATRRAIVVLDDVDVLKEQDVSDLLHQLCALPKVSVVCIAASRQMLLTLAEPARSRLAPRQIVFPRYQPEEIRAILEPVMQRALRDGSWTDEILNQLADHAYGDARRAIALLRHAVQRAQEKGSATLMPEHLQVSNFNHFNPQVDDQLVLMSSHHRLFYDLVSARGPLPGPRLESAYRRACEQQGLIPVSPRAVSKYLSTLCERKILERQHGAKTTGWVYRINRDRSLAPHSTETASGRTSGPSSRRN